MTFSFAHTLHFFAELAIILWFYGKQPSLNKSNFFKKLLGYFIICLPIILYTEYAEHSIISNVWIRLFLRIACYTAAAALLKGFSLQRALLNALVCMSIFTANTNIWLTRFFSPISRDLVMLVGNPYVNSILTTLIKYGFCTLLFGIFLKTTDLDSAAETGGHSYAILGLILISEQYIKNSLNEIYIQGGQPSFNLSIYAIILQLFLLLLLSIFVRYTNSLRQQEISHLQQMSINYQLEALQLQQKNRAELRSLHHDMKNHMLALDHYLSGEHPDFSAAGRYVRELLSRLDTATVNIETGNVLLNGLFAQKYELALHAQITPDIQFNGEPLQFISDMDLCTIFANLWDNAIEACCRISPSQARKITVRGGISNHQYFFSMTNSNPGNIRFFHGLPLTSKVGDGSHGYGLRNIQCTVKKYDGTMTIDIDEKNFTLCIMFPLA